jgi:hypothetical protein
VVLSPGSLDQSFDEDDWLRKEIAEAIRTDRNIVPVLLPAFSFPKQLPADIDALRNYTGVDYHHNYLDGVVERILEPLADSQSIAVAPIAFSIALILALTIALFFVTEPAIREFSANPAVTTRGKVVELVWRADGNVTITPEIGASTESGKRNMYPDRDTTYTLTAKRLFRERSKSVSVRVLEIASPPTESALPDNRGQPGTTGKSGMGEPKRGVPASRAKSIPDNPNTLVLLQSASDEFVLTQFTKTGNPNSKDPRRGRSHRASRERRDRPRQRLHRHGKRKDWERGPREWPGDVVLPNLLFRDDRYRTLFRESANPERRHRRSAQPKDRSLPSRRQIANFDPTALPTSGLLAHGYRFRWKFDLIRDGRSGHVQKYSPLGYDAGYIDTMLGEGICGLAFDIGQKSLWVAYESQRDGPL